MRILLINPSTERDLLSYTIQDIPYLDAKAFFAPHAIAAVAASTPPGHEVKLHDEQMNGPVESLLETDGFDIIGISLVTNQFKRTMEIVRYCRKKELASHIAVGGIGVSNMIPRLRGLVDTIFVGEAEETWPEFLSDVEAGQTRTLYQKVTKPNMATVPAPRWDLIQGDIPYYSAVSVQTSRGCPHDCSFCDVIYTFGRKLRSKTIEQILGEVRLLHGYGAKMIFFADDNFCGNKPFAKEVLREIITLNQSVKHPVGFITQTDITIADDDELLALMADANLIEVQIGVESVNRDSLSQMNKTQNLKRDAREAIRKIQSYGIIALCHIIIGSDADDVTVFEHTARFLADANVTQHTCHPLTAPPGTRLYYQMMREGRLLKQTDELRDKLDIVTNIVPKRMTRVEMMRGMADYWEHVHQSDLYVERALGFLNGVTRRSNARPIKPPGPWLFFRMMILLFWFYLFKVTPDQRKAFLTVFNATRKKARHLMPTMMFLHTGYVIDMMRTRRAAELAREHADLEEANPERVEIEMESGTMSEALRGASREISRASYEYFRREIDNREVIYELVVQATVDYNEQFGARFERFDEVERDHLQIICERILRSHVPTQSRELEAVPKDGPPPGFYREMLDAVDRTIRIKNTLRSFSSNRDSE